MTLMLRFSWLGPPVIESGGRPLRLEMRKTLALLAYLSLSSQSPSRETLAAMFWPEFDQQRSLANLRRNLFSLARSLPSGLLETDRDRVGLRSVDWLQIDAADFRGHLSVTREHAHPPGGLCPACLSAYQKAVAVYTGDFLEGFNLKDCPEFDEWQLYQRESLRSAYATALEQLAAEYQARCEWEQAILHARSWVALDRLNERAQRLLIRLYHRSGQRAMALRQYDDLVDLLQNELGQPPEEATLSLHQTLLSPEAPGGAEPGTPPSRSTSASSEPLIKTKLFIPHIRANRVARPRLFELLDAGAQRSLTLVSAPAGFGKTTLLASWAAHTRLPVAWFSIDEGDNDPVRFVAYLIAAVGSVLAADLSEQLQGFTQSLNPSIQPVLVQLINHLAAGREPFVLVLDDYQFIHSEEVHKALAFLVERMPACLHLVIATRSDPPISLALMRGRDQLVELRMNDLRFSLEESAGFLTQVMALQLSSEDVSALETRTEGWIAGLQMAALAIRGLGAQSARQAISRFIRAFSGSNRYILDYLGEEVLGRRSAEIRSFLLQTSVLERLSGPLCDAVTRREGSQRVLEALEMENLFVVCLDGERRWYRYHHLFGELLRFKLEGQGTPHPESPGEDLPRPEELHLAAAEWLENNHLHAEAVHHFIEAGQYDRAAAIVESQTYTMILATGQAYTLGEWLARLPEDLFTSRPRLNIARAWTLILQNQFAAASERLETASELVHALLAAQERQDPETDSIAGEIALVRGTLAELAARDATAMRVQGLLAWEKLPAGDAMLRGLAAWLLGASYLFDGDTEPAEGYLLQAIQLCRKAGNAFITSVAFLDLGNVRMEQGRHREAYQLLQQGLKEVSSGGKRSHPSLGYLYHGISRILLAWNELEAAEQQLQLGIQLVAQDVPGELLIMNAAMLPYLKLARGKREDALRLAEESLQRVEDYPLPYIPSMVRASLVRFWMRVGDRARVQEWLSGSGLGPDDPVHYGKETEYTALAKALIWQHRTGDALKLLARLHDLARSQGRNGKLFYVLALQALALEQANDPNRGLVALEASLRLAQAQGQVRPYIEEGRPMQELLQLGSARGLWQRAGLDGYVDRLLKAIEEDQAQLVPEP